MSNTVRLHRVFSAPPERVFRAFTDPDALVKWMAPHGFTAHVEHFDVRAGGSYRMSFTNFSTGTKHSFHGNYRQVVQNQLLRYTDQFDMPELAGEIEVTIELKEVSVGTELQITQAGLPSVIPPDACYLGWQESLQLLSLLVNPAIPDE
ncbi:toxin [Acinetobacter sp. WCHAc010034]|uniref:SRPBCC family protein n=1 Tax=Acinetobacter sp. WCHAc010034 TaxID=1879049 RepID=UPI00083B344B|nr:SRPBCC family protein [Acinetobacter sp. WCHAc010034]AYA03852.1 toxin [Acinetobacter sp. WCHAc010034]